MARAQFDREEVLDNAIALFWANGFNGSSMQQIIAATGLKAGSLYLAFGNKEDLYKLALKRYADTGMQTIRNTLEEAPTASQGICNFLEKIVQESAHSDYCSCFLIKTQLELAAQRDDLYDFSCQCLMETEALYREYLMTECDAQQSAARATSLMLHVFGARVYGYQSASAERLRIALHEGLPWLPW